jgi:hypothetical protein
VQHSGHYHTVHFENHKNILRLWQDINEDGHLDTGELANLNTLNHPIQQSEYAFYTNGNAHIANRQPIRYHHHRCQ